MGSPVLEMWAHPVVGLPVRFYAAVTFAAAHQVFRSNGYRFVDVDFFPPIAAPHIAGDCFDHLPLHL